MFEDLPLSKEAVKAIRTCVSMEIRKRQDVINEDETIRYISSVRRRTEQEVSYINTRISRMERFLTQGKGIEAILKKEILDLNRRKEQLLDSQEKASLEVSNNIVSVNLIQVL
ncbi:MAG: hypothetical protein IPP73_20025 [Chitinophagaceae bacterium]|nr:hypothetical protein [Chitinophagaceae bacterium]